MQQFKAVGRIISVWISMLCAFVATAQEKVKKIDINMDKDDQHMWYTSPWVWIIGAVVFILLLLALLRGTEKRG